MTGGRYIGLDRGAVSPRLAGLSAPCACDVPAQTELARPGPFYVAGETIPVADVDLRAYAAARYPDLTRGMIVSVHRPWRLLSPLDSVLAWRIRARQTDIVRAQFPEAPPATEHHAMLYAGGGWCWSQDAEFRLVHLRDYRGCTLTFWDRPGWDKSTRNNLVAECAPHNGRRYGYRDIGAIYAWAVTGREGWLERVGDSEHWICSEAVCELVRAWVEAYYATPGTCLEHFPQRLANWMLARGYRPLAIRPV
jgi:hypothetical protein